MHYLDRFFQPKGWQEDTFTNADGKKIRYGHMEPEGEKKGTVILTTGYADFIEAYYETIHEFQNRGYAVWMMDWAGQGGSDKKDSPQGKPQLLEHHVRDLLHFRRNVALCDDDKPVLMATHSMGGQIGLHHLERHPEDFDGAIMATPLIDIQAHGFVKVLLRMIFSIAVEAGIGDEIIAGSRKHVMRQISKTKKPLRKEDPIRMELHKTFLMLNKRLRAEDPTASMIDSLLESMGKVSEGKFLKSIRTPLLIGIAEKENLVDNQAIHDAMRHFPDAKLVTMKDATHSIWQERKRIREEWWRHVDVFLERIQQEFKPAPKNKKPAPIALPPGRSI